MNLVIARDRQLFPVLSTTPRQFLAQIDQAWTLGGSLGQPDTATITSSPPMVDVSRALGPGALRSMGEEFRDSGFSSLGSGTSWLQPMDVRARSGALRDLRPWTERDANLPSNAAANAATPRGEHEAQRRHARRPTSATGRESSTNATVPPVTGTPTRLSVGRAASKSCSPVRKRRESTNTRGWPHRREGGNARGNVVGSRGGMSGDTGKTDIGRTKKGLGRGVDKSFGEVGFFSPYSRDGRRVSLLK